MVFYIWLACVIVAGIFAKAGPVNFVFMVMLVSVLGPFIIRKNEALNLFSRIFLGVCIAFLIAINFLGPELMQKFLDIITSAR